MINFSNISNDLNNATQSKLADLMGMTLPEPNMAGIDLERYQQFNTAEYRALRDAWGDPLSLNFKLFINYSKPYGLFANESHPNSALAYLKRIGELERYELLKTWIEKFKYFVKERDFMFQTVDGLETILNKRLGDMYNENVDFVNFIIREAIDMRFTSLLILYNKIWFDDIRKVEVLPANLRRFDCSILLFSSGHYNMLMYDAKYGYSDLMSDAQMNFVDDMKRGNMVSGTINSNDYNINTRTLPTLRKLFELEALNNPRPDSLEFNNIMIYLGDAQINPEDSGKNLYSSISNVGSDGGVSTTNLNLKFRFAESTGSWENMLGGTDFLTILAIAASYDKVVKQPGFGDILKGFGNSVLDSFKGFGKGLLNETVNMGKQFALDLANKPFQYANAILGDITPIGNALQKITDPKFLPQMLRNTADLGITKLENKYVYDNIADINNLILQNFSNNFVDIYDNYINKPTPKNRVEYIESQSVGRSDMNTPGYESPVQNKPPFKPIEFERRNIYKPGNF